MARCLAVLLLLAVPARGDETVVSPERARAALLAGLIKPLATLLGRVESRYLGQVIEAELRERDGSWSYEFELLPPDGRLFSVVLDARSGEVIHAEGPVQERR